MLDIPLFEYVGSAVQVVLRTDLHKPFCVASKILQVLQNSPFRAMVYSNVCFFDSPKGK